MSLRDDAMREQPGFPWLDALDTPGLERFLSERGWLEPGERIRHCGAAGAGNMNLTLRVRTDRRDLVVKQSRPWVEKFDEIPAPWDRVRSEIAFYECVAELPGVAERMPRILARDLESRVLCLEYLDGSGDYTDLYDPSQAASFGDDDIESAAAYLGSLHHATRGARAPHLVNREMRALNFAHVFEIPLRPDNGLALDALEPALSEAASRLAGDAAYRERVAALGRLYLEGEGLEADARCLLHGDYFFGSWLRTPDGLRVIDPEFCFVGAPEIDLGCTLAHLALADLPEAAARELIDRYRHHAGALPLDEPRMARFAAAEVMRRLIGVAQLPLPPSEGERTDFRARLLLRSRNAMLAGEIEPLWLSRAEGS